MKKNSQFPEKEKRTTIILNYNDVALVIRERGDSELYIPQQEGDEPISDLVYLISGIAILLKTEDKKFIKCIRKGIHKILKRRKYEDQCFNI